MIYEGIISWGATTVKVDTFGDFGGSMGGFGNGVIGTVQLCKGFTGSPQPGIRMAHTSWGSRAMLTSTVVTSCWK